MLLSFTPTEFDATSKTATADAALVERLSAVPIKELVRKTKIDRNTIRKILRDSPVRRNVLQRVAVALAWTEAG